jgi:hypothetical protein
MKTMKNVFMILTLVGLMFSFASCNKGDDPKPKQTDEEMFQEWLVGKKFEFVSSTRNDFTLNRADCILQTNSQNIKDYEFKKNGANFEVDRYAKSLETCEMTYNSTVGFEVISGGVIRINFTTHKIELNQSYESVKSANQITVTSSHSGGTTYSETYKIVK